MKKIEKGEILQYLQARGNPIQEAAMLRHFFPETEIALESLDFFRAHFNLYHYLYQLQRELNNLGQQFLYIRLASCYLMDQPEEGQCHFFLPEKLDFCRMDAFDHQYCGFHQDLIDQTKKEGLPHFQGLESYYLDAENYFRMSQEELRRITDGSYRLLGSIEEIERSLKVMDLSPDCSMQRIKNRYRYLARETHPDKSGNPLEFQDLSAAYHTLVQWKENSSLE